VPRPLPDPDTAAAPVHRALEAPPCRSAGQAKASGSPPRGGSSSSAARRAGSLAANSPQVASVAEGGDGPQEGIRFGGQVAVQDDLSGLVEDAEVHGPGVFSKPKDRGECLQRQGLAGDRPVVLQLAGGFGVGPVAKLFRELLDIETPIQLVVIAGRNEAVKAQLAAVAPPERHRVKVLGFTDQIDELMAVADLVVSKPGGLTTSETLARGAVMVIVNPIPGQESRNSDFLLENGAAIKVNNLGTLRYKVELLLQDPARLAQLKANVAKLARPRAAYEVVAHSLKIVPEQEAS
jgi:UDP-N-acetylglucosamine:LPS N-acetylglucosamine transferase